MIKNIFPLILLFIFVSPISWTSKGESFYQNNSKTLVTLSSQSSKILADFQGKDTMDTQRNESSPRALIHYELESNRINNLEIDDVKESMNSLNKSSSEIEKKALIVPPKTSRAFLMLVEPYVMVVHSIKFCNDETVFHRLCYTPKTGIAQVELEKALDILDHLKVDKVITLPSLNIPSEWVEAFNGMNG